MPGTLIDSNVLLDILIQDPGWFDWSSNALERCANEGKLYINEIIFAEISIGFSNIEDVDAALLAHTFERLSIPYEAAFLAGKAFQLHRKKGGVRNSTLPDFFIGAHAAVAGLRLLTRDSRRYKTYFPTVELIAP